MGTTTLSLEDLWFDLLDGRQVTSGPNASRLLVLEGADSAALSGDGEVSFVMPRLDLVAGTYKIDVAAHRLNGVPYDYHRLLYTLRVTAAIKDTGIFRPEHRWAFSGGVSVPGLRGPGLPSALNTPTQ